MRSDMYETYLFLLAASTCDVVLLRARDNLAKHHHTIAIHEGNTRETLAILECVCDQGLLRLEKALSHFVRLQRVWLLHLLAACFLAHLPRKLRDTAGCAAAAHEANWRISHLDLVRDIQDLDLSRELARLTKGGVLLVDHHVTAARHVVFIPH